VDPEAAAAELRDAERQIRHGLEESRRAIAALRAAPLEALGLAAALRQRAEQLEQRTGLVMACAIEELPPLPPLVEQTIYRVADEALMNVEKHAAARRVAVALKSGDRLRLEIVDDGVGFEVEPAGASGESRFGLLGMRERAALVGGELTVDTAPGAGTKVILCLNESPFAS
jgi:signal transduction histidine kinase